MNVLQNIPERYRGWAYLALFVAALVLVVALVVVDLIRGGDPADWIAWVAGIIGLSGTGLAAANTSRQR